MNTRLTTPTCPVWLPMTHMPSFDPVGRTLVRAKGVHVWDNLGRRYLCATSGLWNVSCGYGHPRIVEAVNHQLRTLSYGTLFRACNEPAFELAERLLALAPGSGFGRVFYSTSGGTAVETAMKLARRYQRLSGRPERDLVVGLQDSYHGTAYGSGALTGQDIGQGEHGEDLRTTRHVPVNDLDALSTLFARDGDRIAAVFVEPVLGSDTTVVSAEYVAALGRLRQQHPYLLVADEVATGLGRTGTMLASGQWPLTPDAVILSKGITSGYLPLAATLVSRQVCAAFDDAGAVFLHGETQSGNPAACAAALATLDVLADEGLVANSEVIGGQLATRLSALAAVHPTITDVRGLGLMLALDLRTADGRDLSPAHVHDAVEAIRDAGALVYPSRSGVGLRPPLVYSDAHVTELVDCVDQALGRSWW